MRSDNPRLHEWRDRVAWVAQTQRRGVFFDKGQAVRVGIGFFLPRPASLPKRIRHHTVRPDIDKLERAVFDALTGVLWHDDSQVVESHKYKRYDTEGCCVVISVSSVE
jgi:crossover junction endodeoxyribonuclease RusA